MMQDVSWFSTWPSEVRLTLSQVEEKRTPLQLSMDELAKKLSIISFAVIGVICLIGVMQERSWLDMFTIGGMPTSFPRTFAHQPGRFTKASQVQYHSPLPLYPKAYQ
jgi:hypothetical protein